MELEDPCGNQQCVIIEEHAKAGTLELQGSMYI